MKRLEILFQERFRNAKVLDIGCGDGRNIPLMREAGCAVTAVDSNPGQLNTLSDVEMHGTDWEPEPERFDVILASHVIEHLAPKDLCAFMDKWLAALKAGGSMIVVTPVLGERFYYDFTHVRPYYPQSLRMMFRGIDTSMSFSCKWKMELENIWFFRDPFRWRMTRGFYPAASASAGAKLLISRINGLLATIYGILGGSFGRLASWLGIYRKMAG